MFSLIPLAVLCLAALSADPTEDLSALTGASMSEPVGIALPQSFVEADAGFMMQGDGLAVSLETGRMRWMLTREAGEATALAVVDIEPVDARLGVAPVGEQRLPGTINRFHGSPDEWRTGLRTFAAVRYPELWEGVDLLLEAQGETFKGTYVVAPGADPKAVRLRHHGADSVTIDAEGRLIILTPAGELVDSAPVAWQEIHGERRDVAVSFAVEPADDGAVDVSFTLAEHDPSVALWLDPAVIVQAGFLGGVSADYCTGIAVDEDGYVYISGWTLSDEVTFPVVVGPELIWQAAGDPSQGDAFVAKLDPTGTTLIYAGFIGGTEFDFSSGIAVDSLGRAYVGGHTRSSPLQGFPAIGGPSLDQAGIDGWVARVSNDGTSLDFCGYVGGNSEDRVFGIDVDDQFRTYLVGRFKSIDTTLPLLVGPDLTPPGGPTDSFIARLSPSGLSYEYCGYIGGSSFDDITEVKADSDGSAVFAGWTGSTDFPLVGGLGGTYLAGADTVVGRVSPGGSTLLWSGMISSASTDVPGSLALDSSGAVYVAGATVDSSTFPVFVGPELVPGGSTDGFVFKVAPDGQSYEWSGFTGTGFSGSVFVDDDDTVWVVTPKNDGGPTDHQSTLARVEPSGASYDLIETLTPPGVTVGFMAQVPASLTPPDSLDFWFGSTTSLDESVVPVVSGPDVTANGDFDVLVMRIRISLTDGPWSDEGCALAGFAGDPVLVGSGDLSAGSSNSLELSNALPSSTMAMFFGFTNTPTFFYGGTLKPVPWTTLLFTTTTAGGGLTLPFVMPAGVPASTELWLQAAIQDVTAVAGVSISNALLGVTP